MSYSIQSSVYLLEGDTSMLRNFKYSLSVLAVACFAIPLLALEAQAQTQTSPPACLTSGGLTLCLTKSVTPSSATVGQLINFTLTETVTTATPNTNPLVDTLPPGLVFVSVTNNGGSTGTPNTPPCTFSPAADPTTSSGTVSCPTRFLDATHPFVAQIAAITIQEGTFTNTASEPTLEDFAASVTYTVTSQATIINAAAAANTAQIIAAVNAAIAPLFQVNYFAGANGARPDQTVRITNTGATQIGTGAAAAKADICANIYVFRADQQLAECCSCLVTPNGLRTLSVDFDLTHNPLTPGAIGEGVIKIISSVAGPTHDPANSCTPATAATFATPGGTYRAWAVHNQDVSSAGNLSGPGVINQVTETPFLGSPLGAIELSDIKKNCAFITSLGSRAGICSCGRGD
jgi:hypothetical protein